MIVPGRGDDAVAALRGDFKGLFDNKMFTGGGGSQGRFQMESRWSAEGLAKTRAACKEEGLRSRLHQGAEQEQAAKLLFYTTYFPTLFSEIFPLYAREHERRQLLSLPFRGEDFVGVHLPPVQ